MGFLRALGPEMVYVCDLFGASMDGFASARRQTAVPRLWTPAVAGAAAGALVARILPARKSALRCAIGSIVGGGAAAAWSSRQIFGPATREITGRVNAVRDAHWLESNPIDYA